MLHKVSKKMKRFLLVFSNRKPIDFIKSCAYRCIPRRANYLFSLKWRERMNLEIPGAFFSLTPHFWAPGRKLFWGLLQPLFGGLGLIFLLLKSTSWLSIISLSFILFMVLNQNVDLCVVCFVFFTFCKVHKIGRIVDPLLCGKVRIINFKLLQQEHFLHIICIGCLFEKIT